MKKQCGSKPKPEAPKQPGKKPGAKPEYEFYRKLQGK